MMKRAQRMNGLLRRLRRCGRDAEAARTGDGQLLAAFIERRDDEAFARLVQRHGAMVLGVCRRVLGSLHDAEDAFQATFLVLVRRAGTIGRRELIGNWLYGVAYRTALEARAKRLRRMAREKPINDVAGPVGDNPLVERELQRALDRELSRLPDKYRVPVVLCDLEGRGRREVARQLRLPEGTLSSRLATARKLLAARLSRHGPTVGAGLLTATLAQHAAARLPAALADATAKAAIAFSAGNGAASAIVSANVFALTQGVIKAMFLTKLKITAAWLLLIGVLSVGAAGFAHGITAGDSPGDNPRPAAIAANAQDQKPEEDRERLAAALKELRDAQNKLREAQATNDKLRKELEELDEQWRQVHAKLQAEKKLLREQLNDLKEKLQALQAAPPGQAPGEGGPPKKESKLRGLLAERVATLQQVAEAAVRDHRAGRDSFDRVHQAQIALHNAELELCQTDKQRVEVLERIVGQAHRWEDEVARRHKVGACPVVDVLQARAARLEAQIALERAMAKTPVQK